MTLTQSTKQTAPAHAPRTGRQRGSSSRSDIFPGPEPVLGRRILIQRTALTGFRHHAAPQLWPALHRRALLTLRREPENPHDSTAVALYWRGQKLGYVPRGENLVVARLLDRQRRLSARIEMLTPSAERNQRIRVSVLLH
jgi:hypothetical protein